MIKNRSLAFLLLSIVSFTLFSCKGDRVPMLPNVTGRAGEVVLVINDPVWVSESGRALGRVLTSDHPALPQQETMFDLARINHTAFTNIFKTHRNIVIVNISENYSQNHINLRYNVWGKPQIVIEINAVDVESLQGFVESSRDRILEELIKSELSRINNYNEQYEKRELRDHISERLDLSVLFPPGYEITLDTTDFIWIGFSPPTMERIQGVFIYQYDYTDPETFTPDYLIEKRNEFLRKYVPGPLPGSWMTTELLFPPIFTEFMRNGNYYASLRGLWKVENDFMGGPFISHTTLDQERNKVITIEGFVYAPNDKKRNLLRQVEAIIYSLELL